MAYIKVINGLIGREKINELGHGSLIGRPQYIMLMRSVMANEAHNGDCIISP